MLSLDEKAINKKEESGGEKKPALSARAAETFRSSVPPWVIVLLILLLVVLVLVSFALGRYGITPGQLVDCIQARLFDPSRFDVDEELNRVDRVLFNVRLPRVLLVVLVGAALSVSGASYQGMFKNPLVSPDILGSSAGASLGACLAMLLNLSNEYIMLFAFLGGFLAVGCAVWLNRIVKYDAILGLVLGGILVSSLFSSGTSLIKFMADAQDKLPSITFWLMGSFSSTNTDQLVVALFPMVAGFVILMLQSWKLNVLSFGDEEARSMGINTGLTRLIVIFASTLLASTSVAVSGIVGYVGLVIPHLTRALVGPNYKVLLPTSMLVGASYLLIIDNIARMVGAIEIPIGILTSILGIPFFVVIFKRQAKGWRA